jgi:hypothetical protein
MTEMPQSINTYSKEQIDDLLADLGGGGDSGHAGTVPGSIALGDETSAGSTSLYDIAIGSGASAAGGENDNGDDTAAVAIGDHASATDGGGVAIGSHATAEVENAVAIGGGASATEGVAIGEASTAETGIAIGAYTSATGINSLAIGDNMIVTGDAHAAIGTQLLSLRGYAAGEPIIISLEGNGLDPHTIQVDDVDGLLVDGAPVGGGGGGTSIAMGTTAPVSPSTDDLWLDKNTNQLKWYSGTDWFPLGTTDGSDPDHSYNSVMIGKVDTVSNHGVAIGEDAKTGGYHTVGIGYYSRANGNYAVSIGSTASTNGDGGVAIGSGTPVGATASAPGDVAIGAGSGASSGSGKVDRVSVGNGAKAGSNRGIAIGAGAQSQAYGANQITIGYQAGSDSFGDSIALGHAAYVGAYWQSIAIGASATATADYQTIIKNDFLELDPVSGSTASTIVVRSPNGTRWRLSVDNSGVLSVGAA